MPSGKEGCRGATPHVNKGVVRTSVHYSLVTSVATEGYLAIHLYVTPCNSRLREATSGGPISRPEKVQVMQQFQPLSIAYSQSPSGCSQKLTTMTYVAYSPPGVSIMVLTTAT